MRVDSILVNNDHITLIGPDHRFELPKTSWKEFVNCVGKITMPFDIEFEHTNVSDTSGDPLVRIRKVSPANIGEANGNVKNP